jgi:hypothetical protein
MRTNVHAHIHTHTHSHTHLFKTLVTDLSLRNFLLNQYEVIPLSFNLPAGSSNCRLTLLLSFGLFKENGIKRVADEEPHPVKEKSNLYDYS